ncbi:MAG: hypothetical protein AVDCRST_MAG29-126, partial [uncultured Nocardioidaceae bacterium]
DPAAATAGTPARCSPLRAVPLPLAGPLAGPKARRSACCQADRLLAPRRPDAVVVDLRVHRGSDSRRGRSTAPRPALGVRRPRTDARPGDLGCRLDAGNAGVLPGATAPAHRYRAASPQRRPDLAGPATRRRGGDSSCRARRAWSHPLTARRGGAGARWRGRPHQPRHHAHAADDRVHLEGGGDGHPSGDLGGRAPRDRRPAQTPAQHSPL